MRSMRPQRPQGMGAAEHERKRRVLTRPRPTHVARTTDAIVCKFGGLFFTANDAGDVPSGREEHGLGLYLDDTRFLDCYVLTIDGRPLASLSSSSGEGYETLHYLTSPEARRGAVPSKGDLGILRRRVIRDGVLYEVVSIHNYAPRPIRCRAEITYGSSFDDVFRVRGFLTDHGKVRRPALRRSSAVLRYDGLDGKRRTTTIAFSPRPSSLTSTRAKFSLVVPPGKEQRLAITVTPHEQSADGSGRAERATAPRSEPDDLADLLESDQREWVEGFASVHSSDELLDRVMERALRDLRVLRSERRGLHFIAAGVPWFATLFGRDSCIVGLQTLPFGPRLAAETLRLLARFQAAGVDAFRDAEPGKMLHELRTGELADADRIPQSPAYYGTVDATLLWTILLGQYINWTGDLDLARDLRSNLDAAVAWSLEWGDHDGDGYIDYAGKYKGGLINQGWKDSGTSIIDQDGSLATPPIALCEVQGYAYRAWRGAARVLELLGEDRRCADLMQHAASLRRRFERDYWSSDLDCYVLARQKGGRTCDVVSSNAGQVLWSGIAGKGHAARVTRRLMRDDMFSGWGIRTISSTSVRYNPNSYHLGSVWPHDNSLIVGGLRRYGHDDEAERVFSAIYEAAAGFRDQRMPELFCGYARDPAEAAPVEYPVASSPQAWAAGAIPYALWQILGLRARATNGKLLVARPRLPRGIQWLDIRGLTVGDRTCDLRFERHRDDVRVRVTRGKVRIERTQ